MKRALLCAALALIAVPCFAGQSWDGTWKMNVAKSKLTGDTFTVEDKGNGMMHYSNGIVSFDFACDGKAYTIIANRTRTCTGSQAAGYDIVTKAGDNVLAKQHESLSADGKTLTIHGTEMRPDGSKPEYSDVYKRQTGTSGLVGKWMDVQAKGGADSMVIERKADWIKISTPEFRESVEGKMDGSGLPVTGANVPPGVTRAFKTEGANKLHYAVAYNGKVLVEGTETLSGDGKTLVEEEWAPGRMNEKATMVYERQ